MKTKKNKKKLKIKNPEKASIQSKEVNAWMDIYKKEQEELAKQTWPTWLLPEEFQGWFNKENEYRKTVGKPLLPNPPEEVIQEVLGIKGNN